MRFIRAVQEYNALHDTSLRTVVFYLDEEADALFVREMVFLGPGAESTANRLPVYHFDMYRVESWDDLYSTGFFDYLNAGGIVIVEWSENIENAIPEGAFRIKLQQGKSENERIISLDGVDL